MSTREEISKTMWINLVQCLHFLGRETEASWKKNLPRASRTQILWSQEKKKKKSFQFHNLRKDISSNHSINVIQVMNSYSHLKSMPHISSLTRAFLYWGGQFQNNVPCFLCSNSTLRRVTEKVQNPSSAVWLLKDLLRHANSVFLLWKHVWKTKSCWQRYTQKNKSYNTELSLFRIQPHGMEQGYVVALCLPNLPHEKHRLVSYGKCALPTKSLKRPAECVLGVSANIRISSFKTGRRRAVSWTNAWQGSQSSHGTSSVWLGPINSRTLLIPGFTSNYAWCSETNQNLEYLTSFTYIRMYVLIFYLSLFLVNIYTHVLDRKKWMHQKGWESSLAF